MMSKDSSDKNSSPKNYYVSNQRIYGKDQMPRSTVSLLCLLLEIKTPVWVSELPCFGNVYYGNYYIPKKIPTHFALE